jgi:transcription factor IIIB 90 kDa subunit
LLKKSSKYSKRINYDALKDIFADVDDNVGLKLYTFGDNKDDQENGDADDYVTEDGHPSHGLYSEKEDEGWTEEIYEQEV